MLEIISVERLHEIYDRLPFPYQTFRESTINETTQSVQFYTVGSSTAGVRPMDQWNALGRELHNPVQVDRHARIVAHILQQLRLTDFFVQQAVPEALWFRGNTQRDTARVGEILEYLVRRGMTIDFSKWRGAFLVREEFGDFLARFLDYPFLLRYYNLEVFPTEAPLAMVINHHLCIEYISPSGTLTEDLRSRIDSEGILEFPGRGRTNP